MSGNTGKGVQIALVIAAAAVVVWGVLGLLEFPKWAYAGFREDPDFRIVEIDPGSPAESAGFQLGDRILTSGGIDVSDRRALTDRGRAAIGSSRIYELERDGETLAVQLTFSKRPPRQAALWIAGSLVGFCFVGFGLWAFLGNPSTGTRLLSIVCLCLGLAFCDGPYFESYAVRAILGVVTLTLVALSFAALLHFLLEFPKRKAFLERPGARKILYGPAVGVVLFLIYQIVFRPTSTTALNQFTNLLLGAFVVVYFGLSAAVMVSSFRRATPEERTALGLDFVLFGTLVGLIPVAIVALVHSVAPAVNLPGQDFYFLTLVLIPISLALATRRWHGSTA